MTILMRLQQAHERIAELEAALHHTDEARLRAEDRLRKIADRYPDEGPTNRKEGPCDR